MTTPTSSDVITTYAFPAVDAHRIARITYRQLDHWARQGWVQPSLDTGYGRSGKRLYSAADVVRLDLLRHLAVSKVNAAVAGPAVAAFDLPTADDVRVVWGPVSRTDGGEAPTLRVLDADETLPFLESGGAFIVYNPANVRARITAVAADPAATTADGVAGAAAAPGSDRPSRTTTGRRRSA